MTGTKPGGPDFRNDLELTGGELRWCCDTKWLPFATTEEVEPISGIVGQEDAMNALTFGLEMTGPGQNIFVRGLAGSGRLSLVRQLIEEIKPTCPPAPDRCYVHDFARSDRPQLITLPRGQGARFQHLIEELVRFIRDELSAYLSSDSVRALRTALDDRVQEQIRELGKPFEEELQSNQLALVPVQVGQTVQPVILPVIDGQPVPAEQFQELRQQGKISDADAERVHEKIAAFAKQFKEISSRIEEVQNQHREKVHGLYQEQARTVLLREVRKIEAAFPQEAVKRFLAEIVEDVVERRLNQLKDPEDFTRLYRVNLLQTHQGEPCPVIIENTPTLQNLLGSIDREFQSGALVRSDHLMIRAGTLVRADGGFLILEARDVLTEPGAWKVLMRTLRTGKLEIVPSELTSLWFGPVLKPEPIEINVKVVLLGDPDLYYALDAYDPDFPHLFKVLADFDTTIRRDETGVRYYAGVLARVTQQEELPPFARDAVAALCEHGARVAARRDRLTIRFGRILDVAREAAFLSRKQGGDLVTADEIREAIRLGKRRGDLPARRFRKLVADGTIRIQVEGWAQGQVNGLAVIQAGPMVYGFPTRITATIGPGTAGAINIEREAELSGSIHTKGFYILGGLLRHLLRTQHPLAFSASVAFEQSYGGIDGDSASGAEMCCLLSALTGVPLRQDVAMTGAIDQLGHVQPVGSVTEKVEGFFETCRDLGLTGTQGVIVPRPNAGDLMLREDVSAACGEQRFHVYAVATVQEALEILTGVPAGEADSSGKYPEGTLLHSAEAKAYEYWLRATLGPSELEDAAVDEETGGSEPQERTPATGEESPGSVP